MWFAEHASLEMPHTDNTYGGLKWMGKMPFLCVYVYIKHDNGPTGCPSSGENVVQIHIDCPTRYSPKLSYSPK